jgi:HEPN domain-containing protein
VIPEATLKRLARERLKDSKALLRGKRHDGAVYLCGYAIELALKARITKHLRWAGFPATKKEFESFHSLKVHDLDALLAFSGQEARIKARFFAEWSAVVSWDPEVRYKEVGSATGEDAKAMIRAAEVLVKTLCQ